MKKILFSILVCLPCALYGQGDNAGKFKFESIPLKEDGSNKEFYSNYKQGIVFYNKADSKEKIWAFWVLMLVELIFAWD